MYDMTLKRITGKYYGYLQVLLCLIVLLMPGRAQSQDKPATFKTIGDYLQHARKSIKANDTVTALGSLDAAARLGLYTEDPIQANGQLSRLLNSTAGKGIRLMIAQNYRYLQNPANFKIHTEDIDLFWKVYPRVNEPDAAQVFFDEYIAKGSPGLKTFYKMRMRGSTQKLVQTIRENPGFYNAIKPVTLSFKHNHYRRWAGRLKRIYPDAIFPPLYFLIGQLNNVGTPDGYAGMLIGTEHLCRTPAVDAVMKDSPLLPVLFPKSSAGPIIVHEMIHLQQKYPPARTLLDMAVAEGAADFITHIVTGKVTDEQVYSFGKAHEAEVKAKFISQMAGTDTDDWIFNTYNEKTGYPGNMGYYVGYKICEAYYQKAANKKAAVKEILEIKDFKAFASHSSWL